MSDTSVSQYDLAVVGGNSGGLSVAIAAQAAGLRVRILEASHSVAYPSLVHSEALDVGYEETPQAIDYQDEAIVVETNRGIYRTRACVVAQRKTIPQWDPEVAIGDTNRVYIDELPDGLEDTDLLIVGTTDHAVELTVTAANQGANVVLAAKGLNNEEIAASSADRLVQLEKDRRVTLLLNSAPISIYQAEGFPMAHFGDRRTPDLQFDHVVFASHRLTSNPGDVRATTAAIESGLVWFQGLVAESGVETTARGWDMAAALMESAFPDHAIPAPAESGPIDLDEDAIHELREQHYNATITHFEPAHSDLWVLRVRPDRGTHDFIPGQYASLGLGYWEPRIDEATDNKLQERLSKLVRRSYSISSRIFDENGYLVDEGSQDELEFYIVLVPATDGRIPGLTPRLALKRPGDRIYLGPKVAGRYTLDSVTNPAGTVLFFSTGTGEAPHNAMITELLRKGHFGPIVSAVSVRQWDDLGYRDEHEQLARRYPNYRFVPLPTREPDVPKRYIQDLIRDEDIGVPLDPRETHVFLCGNPAMIGLPEDGAWPEPEGVVQLLTDRGFTLARRGEPGNIHVEEYW